MPSAAAPSVPTSSADDFPAFDGECGGELIDGAVNEAMTQAIAAYVFEWQAFPLNAAQKAALSAGEAVFLLVQSPPEKADEHYSYDPAGYVRSEYVPLSQLLMVNGLSAQPVFTAREDFTFLGLIDGFTALLEMHFDPDGSDVSGTYAVYEYDLLSGKLTAQPYYMLDVYYASERMAVSDGRCWRICEIDDWESEDAQSGWDLYRQETSRQWRRVAQTVQGYAIDGGDLWYLPQGAADTVVLLREGEPAREVLKLEAGQSEDWMQAAGGWALLDLTAFDEQGNRDYSRRGAKILVGADGRRIDLSADEANGGLPYDGAVYWLADGAVVSLTVDGTRRRQPLSGSASEQGADAALLRVDGQGVWYAVYDAAGGEWHRLQLRVLSAAGSDAPVYTVER